MTLTLSGRTAVVTGAASGIGAALALRAAGLGMDVAACDRDADGLERLAAAIEQRGARHILRCIDVSDAKAMTAFAADCAAVPPITLLFANAGVLRGGTLLSTPLDQWRLLFDVNILGTVATLQAFAPVMRAHGEPGRIVVTGSTGSMLLAPGLAAYCATKHALWPMVEALQSELEGTAIGASLLMPGAVSTRIFEAVDPDRDVPADSITPEAAAEMAFAGALAGHAKILTHPAYVTRIESRFGRVIEELSRR